MVNPNLKGVVSMKMSKPSDFKSEVIAVYYNKDEGTELHFRRDGRAYWRKSGAREFSIAVEHTTFELIEKWMQETPYGIHFERVDLAIEKDEDDGDSKVC